MISHNQIFDRIRIVQRIHLASIYIVRIDVNIETCLKGLLV